MGIDGARRAVGSSLKPALALAPAPAAAAAAVARGGGGGGAGGGRSSQVRTFDLPGIVGETGMFFIFFVCNAFALVASGADFGFRDTGGCPDNGVVARISTCFAAKFFRSGGEDRKAHWCLLPFLRNSGELRGR